MIFAEMEGKSGSSGHDARTPSIAYVCARGTAHREHEGKKEGERERRKEGREASKEAKWGKGKIRDREA